MALEKWRRRRGVRVLGVSHLMFEGMDIQTTTIKDPYLDKIMPVGPRVLDVGPSRPDAEICPN